MPCATGSFPRNITKPDRAGITQKLQRQRSGFVRSKVDRAKEAVL
jgi:hypothetical protein